MQTLPENSPKQKTLMEHTGDLIADLMIPENELEVTGTETTYDVISRSRVQFLKGEFNIEIFSVIKQ